MKIIQISCDFRVEFFVVLCVMLRLVTFVKSVSYQSITDYVLGQVGHHLIDWLLLKLNTTANYMSLKHRKCIQKSLGLWVMHSKQLNSCVYQFSVEQMSV